MGALADEVTDAIRGLLDRPVVILGHSMGALVGYEVTGRLTACGEHRAVRRLVVSGSAAPGRTRAFRGQQDAGSRSDDDLVLMLEKSGAQGLALLDDPGMRSVLLPAIRNDYRIVQAYAAEPRGALDVEITALSGLADPFIRPDEVRAWSSVTSGRFRYRSFPGGHFYLTHREEDVVRAALEAIGTGDSHASC
ncbi:hypothetical protein ADL15_39495 [Actinoplanes awajinensis subsp. mycoplanecinus]|uniref:Thioesterase domain-containing protein n=1 Tax=Actinoplanes awajinensis subsp. mycoplanecinus TaxID=135947 RepID=A0A101JFN7_9ACTN|nr:hypothetical protein ADL15_39495 [Actinoplanes awajinensis subsp. mycoplanecinus]